MIAVIAILILSYCALSDALRPPSFHSSLRSILKSSESEDNNFDAKEFNDALKAMGPVWGKNGAFPDAGIINSIRDEQVARAEQIYREYPFANVSLPILPDCNNYYSGKFEDFFWHQNADQVLVYMPIGDDVSKRDIEAKFDALRVSIDIKGENFVKFDCLERIIPDGSFWVIEEDKSGKRYIQLDLEKRFRMINWKSLFGEAVTEQVDDIEKRSQVYSITLTVNY